MNVTFIGMAGAGKSYIGSRLAHRLGFEFVDTDSLLAREYGKSIQSILEQLGEQNYLQAETEILINYTSGRDNLLISPGGSIVYRDDAMDHIKHISKVIYLKVPFEAIEERLNSSSSRAIIGLGARSLRELYEERMPLYEKNAHHVIETAQYDTEGVLREIARFLNSEKIRGYFPGERDFYSSEF